jgi:hypothetical protein
MRDPQVTASTVTLWRLLPLLFVTLFGTQLFVVMSLLNFFSEASICLESFLTRAQPTLTMKVKEGQAVWVKDPAIAKDNLYNIGTVRRTPNSFPASC